MSKYLKIKIKIRMNSRLSALDDDRLLEKYEASWTKIEDLQNIETNALPVYNNRYIKTKIRKYGE